MIRLGVQLSFYIQYHTYIAREVSTTFVREHMYMYIDITYIDHVDVVVMYGLYIYIL